MIGRRAPFRRFEESQLLQCSSSFEKDRARQFISEKSAHIPRNFAGNGGETRMQIIAGSVAQLFSLSITVEQNKYFADQAIEIKK